ncbi:hypothetical protein [Zavarzinella formosa]|uniref:hypothetical protein n=1 Tax=Zavarzinella formosa TaxID=360055 RepID=UPI0002DDAA83|nr:hypothetical protein [Zavarzinella formosa]
MPIRFRCAHCDKLLGIARRKAGSIVNCPQCGQPLIVPTPDEEGPEDDLAEADPDNQTELATDPTAKGAKPKPAASAKLFEQDDIDRLLEASPAINPRHAAGTSPHPAAGTTPSRAIVPQAVTVSNGMPLPLPAPVPSALPIPVPSAGGLSVGKIIGLILIVFVLVVAAFVAGLFVGKGMK